MMECWVSLSEEHDSLWLVVTFVGAESSGSGIGNCPKHLVVAPVIAPFSKSFWAAAEEVFQGIQP